MQHCFLITTYEETRGVKRSIFLIRELYGRLSNCPIIVVSTAENVDRFDFLKKYQNVHFIHFKDAPGNKGNTTYLTKATAAETKGNWRSEFLPARIFISIELGLKKAIELGCDTCLHTHADTYWLPWKIHKLIKEIELIKKEKLLFIGDMSAQNEVGAKIKGIHPTHINFQPEGLLFYLPECQKTDFGTNFSKIFYSNCGFIPTSYAMLEMLIGQFAVFCLSGKNILKPNDTLPPQYDEKVRTRMSRDYHGVFQSGIRNIPVPEKNKKLFIRRVVRQIKQYFTTPYQILPPSKTQSHYSIDVL